MAEFLILKLQGVMQAWGGHTYEDYRPTHLFPTRSGLVGLLGACCPVDRDDVEGLAALSASFRFAVRDDAGKNARRMTDYHTVRDARQVGGKTRQFPVESHREYLCDAAFTVALCFAPDARFSLEGIREATQRPRYTPFLGRRSCPLGRPLFEAVKHAESLLGALAQVPPAGGTVYSEDNEGSLSTLVVRDVPTPGRVRKFATREVFIHAGEGCHVPK